MEYSKELARRRKEAEEILKDALPKEEGEQRILLSAMRYSALAGGKRLRPILVQLSFELFGGEGEAARPFMAAMEMIHTHSLIHDDLPAMDNDEYRRGKKTTHVVYGEAMAILAGDALLNYAYETAARALSDCGTDTAALVRAARALRILARKTGAFGMIGGQSVDVQLEGKEIGASGLDFIYALKTGALLEASLMTGAALAGADEAQIAVMEQVGQKIGLAFQIRDDILDVSGEAAALGKSTGSDAKNHKTTYVTLRGLERAARDADRLTGEALELLDSLPLRHPFLRELLLSLSGRTF